MIYINKIVELLIKYYLFFLIFDMKFVLLLLKFIKKNKFYF